MGAGNGQHLADGRTRDGWVHEMIPAIMVLAYSNRPRNLKLEN